MFHPLIHFNLSSELDSSDCNAIICITQYLLINSKMVGILNSCLNLTTDTHCSTTRWIKILISLTAMTKWHYQGKGGSCRTSDQSLTTYSSFSSFHIKFCLQWPRSRPWAKGGGGGQSWFTCPAGLFPFCHFFFFLPKIRRGGPHPPPPDPSPRSATGLHSLKYMFTYLILLFNHLPYYINFILFVN